MTSSEKDALVNYLEFHLLTFCEQIEPLIDHHNVNDVYINAFKILQDIDSSIIVTNNTSQEKR